jgi:hypothetical protein
MRYIHRTRSGVGESRTMIKFRSVGPMISHGVCDQATSNFIHEPGNEIDIRPTNQNKSSDCTLYPLQTETEYSPRTGRPFQNQLHSEIHCSKIPLFSRSHHRSDPIYPFWPKSKTLHLHPSGFQKFIRPYGGGQYPIFVTPPK